ncbi:retinol dehydrogenase 2-like [Mizuhopecten yessoensis]|uniref:Retinol dehydrogenase 2 n=1 Tax=Mizuhopecten yessoensis TaxID=6573 RepID=A0A210PQX3_MIZYE|nr:retinol dehydrogenase 2-like [Mizuhopecten yessoensis]OWF38836.1 Retinol dehydrogenase 2 [Mizuhopecten yessoensis]
MCITKLPEVDIHSSKKIVMFLEIIGVILVITVLKWIKRSFKLKDIRGRYVFITGCDSGFGKLLASRLDSLGVHVFAGCFTTNTLEEYRKTSNTIEPIALDVTDMESIEKAYQFVKSKLPENTGLWALVNNAGTMGHFGPATWLSEEDYQRPLSVNLFGMVRMVRVFLPLVLKSRGRIINMTSGSGKIAATNVGPYSISKFAAEAYCDTLRRELYRTGVSVHIIEPGCFNTGFTDLPLITKTVSSNFEKLDDDTKEYYGTGYADKINEAFRDMIKTFESPKLYKVVDSYEHAVTARYPLMRYVVGYDSNSLIFLNTYFPEWLVDFLLCATSPTPKGRI